MKFQHVRISRFGFGEESEGGCGAARAPGVETASELVESVLQEEQPAECDECPAGVRS